MKKLIIILAALLAVSVLLVSCAKDTAETPDAPQNEETVTPDDVVTPDDEAVEGDENVEDIQPEASGLQATVDAIYEKYPVPFMAGTIPAEMINDDSFAYYTGMTDSSKVEEVLVSESMIGAQAYSLVLVTVKDGEDVNTVADAMINGIDQRKWMCVEADLIRTVTHGNTVMLVMIDSSMEIGIDGFVTAFEEVVGAVEYEATKA